MAALPHRQGSAARRTAETPLPVMRGRQRDWDPTVVPRIEGRRRNLRLAGPIVNSLLVVVVQQTRISCVW
jgi:hypothetical protein